MERDTRSLRDAETLPTLEAFDLPMHNRPALTPRTDHQKPVDQDAQDLTLRALALLDESATALELSRAIRERLGVTTSTSRVYVAIGQLWERGYVTVELVPIRRGGRSSRQTVVSITARGRTAVATILAAIARAEGAARSAL